MADDDLDDLVLPLAGSDWWNVPASGDVPALKVTDGPTGARGERFTGGPPSVVFPCGAALGATWDVALLERVGAALADETKAKGAHVLLGPTVNLQRSPLGGRHFECLAEDPVLTAELAVAYVAGLQGNGVAACVKHLVCNDTEHDRFQISSEPSERALREVYLLPFERALRDAGAWSTMGAYNRLHGTHCCEHPRLLTTILRDEWGWDGVVISDWFATHSIAPALAAGLDLEMPGPTLHRGPALAAAVRAGEVDRAAVDRARQRLKLLAARTGADRRPPAPDGPGGSAAAVALAREVAAAATVLLRNDGGLLPLPADLGTIAVVGPGADREVLQGGGSAGLVPTGVVTVADGLRARLGAGRVVHEEGCGASRGTPALDGHDLDDLVAEVVGHDGEVLERLHPRDFRVAFLDVADGDQVGWALRATARFTPRRTGPHRFKVKTNGQASLLVGGVDAGDGDGDVELVAGEAVGLEVRASTDQPGSRLAVEVRCARPEPPDALERAVAAAAGADVAVVVVGLDGDWETEGRDRDDFALPGRQDELVRAVVAAQPRTVVVVVAGSPVDLPWADEVPALLWAWYPGQEGGHAIADVLIGDAEPGGRLPCTIPRRIEDTPAFHDTPPEPGRLRYEEGVFVGHRWYDEHGIEPRFPFGHGLGYTTFTISPPRVDGRTVAVDVANTGDRAGAEVVQLYVGAHPRQLRAFTKVALAPGEATTWRYELTDRDLSRWDDLGSCWQVDTDPPEVWVGRSSRDLAKG